MRSLSYLLTGRPKNLDDCLDFSARELPLLVRVGIETRELLAEAVLMTHVVARFTWHFPNQLVSCEKLLGSFADTDPEPVRSRFVRRIHPRLTAILESLRLKNIPVEVTNLALDSH